MDPSAMVVIRLSRATFIMPQQSMISNPYIP